MLDIRSMFLNVAGAPKLKNEILSTNIKNQNYNKDLCLMVGDSLTDYNAACDAGINFLLRVTYENRLLFQEIDCPRILDFRGSL